MTCAIGTRPGADLLLDTAVRASRAAGMPLRLVSLVALDPLLGVLSGAALAQHEQRPRRDGLRVGDLAVADHPLDLVRVNHSLCMSCSSCSRSCSPSVMPVARNTQPRWLLIPGATSSCPSTAIEAARSPVSSRSSRRASSARLEVARLSRRRALRKLPAPQAERVAELLDELEPVAVLRAITSAYVGLSIDAVDAVAAVGAPDIVLAQPHPLVPVDLTGRDTPDGIHAPSIAERGRWVTSPGVLLTSLNPAAVAAGDDIADAVRIDGAVLSRSDLVGAATSVAERVARRAAGGGAGHADRGDGAGRRPAA